MYHDAITMSLCAPCVSFFFFLKVDALEVTLELDHLTTTNLSHSLTYFFLMFRYETSGAFKCQASQVSALIKLFADEKVFKNPKEKSGARHNAHDRNLSERLLPCQ